MVRSGLLTIGENWSMVRIAVQMAKSELKYLRSSVLIARRTKGIGSKMSEPDVLPSGRAVRC